MAWVAITILHLPYQTGVYRHPIKVLCYRRLIELALVLHALVHTPVQTQICGWLEDPEAALNLLLATIPTMRSERLSRSLRQHALVTRQIPSAATFLVLSHFEQRCKTLLRRLGKYFDRFTNVCASWSKDTTVALPWCEAIVRCFLEGLRGRSIRSF